MERYQTSSDGANWIEYLTGCFGGSPFSCPRQLWNFAFAGADISGHLYVYLFSLYVIIVET
jgi:hypothetical protein